MVGSDTKWWEVIQNGGKGYKMVGSDTKWWEVIQNDTEKQNVGEVEKSGGKRGSDKYST